MKKLLALILCLVMALAVSGCGSKTSKSTENEAGGIQTQSEEKSGTEKGDTEEPLDSAEVLAEIVDEFNNTDDPEVKEQLRQRLEEIFAQAEAASIGVIPE